MSSHQNIEDLFRSKLGEAEITPSPGAWKAVQRKLRMKQFLRFDAGKFNVWYAGALLVAGLTTVVLLNDGPSENPIPENIEIPVLESSPEAENEQAGPELLKEEKKRRVFSGRSAERNPEVKKEDLKKNQEGKRREERKDKEAERQEESAGIPLNEETEVQNTEQADSASNLQSPVAQFTLSETMGCAPLLVEFHNASVYALDLNWDFGDGVSSKDPDPVYIFEKAGIYAVALTAMGSEGDSSVSYEVIRVYPAPTAAFEMAEGLQELDGTTSVEVMNYSTGAFSYSWEMIAASGDREGEWSSNEFQPTFSNSDIPEQAKQIRLVALNEHGCTDTAAADITGLGIEQHTINFPTVFSGNPTGPSGGFYNPNDQRLDVFRPHYSEQPAEYHLRVYSKTGEVIFETRDILQGWDGYYMQASTPSAVYIWVATGTWHNGSTFNLRGDVTLLWNSR